MTRSSRRPFTGIRQACDACHFKKVRCLRGPEEGDGPCQKCSREGVACVFSPALKTGRPPKKPPAQTRPEAGPILTPPSTLSSDTPSQPIDLVSQALPSTLEETPIPWEAWDGMDMGIVCFPSADCPLQHDFDELKKAAKPEVIVLKRLEQLSAFQQQLVAKRREHAAVFSRHPGTDASSAIQEMLHITQKVTKFNAWLMMGGAKFAFRKPMLDSMSDETALMMVVSPATLVLEVFVDILELAFPSLKKRPSESDFLVSGEAGVCAIDPALLSNASMKELGFTPAAVPDIASVHNLANPVCIYILLTALQDQLDSMRKAVELGLDSFPRMDTAKGAQGLLPAIMDQYSEKIRFVQGHITKAGGDNLMAGLD
ncbi:Fusaric acid cluster transcription factor FUB10 [Colletotrichum aenigma]|uniref:Fusaric acid cluster transcription factor FUB10 n=1 Tax=Colletotrichum aenigma TaxID=1215731 RepID=UPI001872337F|nr:Fusaric acid cluster transcription factor FUB10 [Colletotrichum aenigma]KAF5518767.1 Fusaric acid cluster transcription factor FUB10 [Colletotrichum aenigma]